MFLLRLAQIRKRLEFSTYLLLLILSGVPLAKNEPD